MKSLLPRVPYRAERAEYASGIVEALTEAGDSAAADSLGRRYRSGAMPTVTPSQRPADVADSLAYPDSCREEF